MQNLLFKYFSVKRDERRALSWACVWFATLLGGYYMVRPVREALGSAAGAAKLPDLLRDVFLTMLIAVPLYSQLVSRFRRRIVVPLVYRFLLINLLLFSAALKWADTGWTEIITRVFFVWVSVYVLFAMSLFWSVMADTFSTDQGKRLFGMIAGCGTVGALLGSAFAGQSSKVLGIAWLLLVPATLMEVGLFCYRRLEAARADFDAPTTLQATGGNPFAGFVHVLRSPYLLSICGYILITALCGTSLYLTQAEIVKAAYPDEEKRVVVFAWMDFATQALTVALQFLVAGRLMRFSLPLALRVLPTAYLLGFAVLGYVPLFAVLCTVVVVTRASVYGITVPAQGVLFTVVSREDKYKAKNIIDTLVTRGGDAAAGQIGNLLRQAGVSIAVLSWSMIPLTLGWIALASLLGWKGMQRSRSQEASSTV
jgi:AAA family ATP:ADP antiporter